MGNYRPGILIKLACIDSMRILRSSKCLILLMCCIFININIIDPIRGLSRQMETKVSVFEPFVALSNSGLVLLFIPLMFIVLMSEFPDNSAFQYFYSIRLSKTRWVMIQLLNIQISTFVFMLFIILFSVIMISDCSSFQTGFSDAVRYYSARYPELSYSYVAQLFPLNMLNQLSLSVVVLYSVSMMYLYLVFLIRVILLFSVIRRKTMGIVLDFLIIFTGAVLSSVKSGLQWLFPFAHTVSWGHFTEVTSRQVFPIKYSIIYMLAINVVITALIVVNSKKVRPE